MISSVFQATTGVVLSMASMAFDSIKVQGGTRLELVCTTITDSGEDLYELWFEFNHPLYLSDDTIGVALSTLCGRAYNHISYDLALSEGATKRIHEFTLATISARSAVAPVRQPRQGNLLSFSGGFDSLAALSLMPSDTRLVSMDFGGRFGRERLFFERFDTTVVSTNLLSTPLSRNSWSFMGIGAILVSDHFRPEYHTFGGIFEAGPDNMRAKPGAATADTFPPFKAAGYVNAPYVHGLTEIGTLSIILQQRPEVVARSLLSVASPGEEKLYRKAVLVDVVAESMGVSLVREEVPRPAQPHFQFGTNFALDLLTLYVISKTGDGEARGLARGIPSAAIELAGRLDMAFMGRANPTLYERFPKALAPDLHKRLAENGVHWYTEGDWAEFQQVRDFLAAYHPVVGI